MPKPRLTREDWTRAALAAMSRGGPAAVAVDPLAKILGATRGSFYWHFTDREALLVAALELWEQVATEDLIAVMEKIRNPLDRLRTLLHEALRDRRPNDVHLEPAIVAHAHDPVVAPVLRRVTERRIGYLTECYRQLGMARTRPAGRASWRTRHIWAGSNCGPPRRTSSRRSPGTPPPWITFLVN